MTNDSSEMPFSKQGAVISTVEGPQIRAFAKIEFEDGPFYMNTYAVELGRDIVAAKAAAKLDTRGSESAVRGSKNGSSSAGHGSHTPVRARRDGSVLVNRSVVSESGGVMGVDTFEDDDQGWREATSGSSLLCPTGTSLASQPRSATRADAVDRVSLSHRASGLHPVDPSSLLPSPNECPLIPIHPPVTSVDTGGHKGISRKHVKIAYSFDKQVFELHIYGRNGAFVDDQWHASGESLTLHSGSLIQIGGVSMNFVLPEDVPGAQRQDGGMSTNNGMTAVVGDGSDDDMNTESNESDGDGELSAEDIPIGIARAESDDGDEDSDGDVDRTPSPVPTVKKRGPGRPPKHGGYTNAKAPRAAHPTTKAKALSSPAPALAAAPAPTVVGEKRKVGRPRKHPLPKDITTPSERPEKRKYIRRKGADIVASTEVNNEAGVTATDKKEAKPKKPPRSPSPVFDESKLTEEDLQKPQSSYVVLIHEALTNSTLGTLSLPQIYRAIERKYPYFKLRVTTTGWQSSVRHNLSQHDAFRKVEREGKGWVWGTVPGVPIEKEKRRKASPINPPSGGKRLPQSANTPMPKAESPFNGPPSFGPSQASEAPRPSQLASAAKNTVRPVVGQSPYDSSVGHINSKGRASFANRQTTVFPGAAEPGVPPTLNHGHAQPRASQQQQQQRGQLDSSIPPAMSSPPSTVPSSVTRISQVNNIPSSLPRPQMPLTVTADISNAIQSFRTHLVKSLPRSSHTNEMIESAIDRVKGVSNQSRFGGEGDAQELTIIKALRGIITSGSTTTVQAQPSTTTNNGDGGGTTALIPGYSTPAATAASSVVPMASGLTSTASAALAATVTANNIPI